MKKHIKRVMLAEDLDMIRDMLRYYLQSNKKIEFNFVRNGIEAVALYEAACESESDCFDLLIFDIAMPESSGLDAAEEIRMRKGDKKVKIIFLTNLDVDPVMMARIRAMDLEPDKVVLSKVENIDRIDGIIAQILEEEEGAGDAKAECGDS